MYYTLLVTFFESNAVCYLITRRKLLCYTNRYIAFLLLRKMTWNALSNQLTIETLSYSPTHQHKRHHPKEDT